MRDYKFQIPPQLNWLTICHLTQAFFLFIFNTLLVTKFFHHTDLAIYFLLFSASTVTINHFRWAIPTFLLKDITSPLSKQLQFLTAMIVIGWFFSTVQFYFISGEFDILWWYIYIYSAFLVNYFANLLAALGNYRTYCVALIFSGAVIATGSIYIYTNNSISVFDLSLIVALSQFGPAAVMSIPVTYHFLSKPRLETEPTENVKLNSYIKFVFYEIPTRPIPFIEKYIANLISPTALISIEIIQRLCLRPVSLLLMGRVFKETVVILRNNKSIFFGDIAKAIFGNNFFIIISLIIIPLAVLFSYNLFNPLNSEIYFVAIIMLATLFIANVLDIYRKKFVSDGYVDRIMTVNLIMGASNILFLLFLYHYSLSWMLISVSAFINATLTLIILYKLQINGERT